MVVIQIEEDALLVPADQRPNTWVVILKRSVRISIQFSTIFRYKIQNDHRVRGMMLNLKGPRAAR